MKRFSRKTVIIFGSLACLICLCFISSLVWGKTIRMAQANRNLISGNLAQARQTYEDLAVELPNSPYVLHNLGLAAYREGKTNPAAEYFQKTAGKLKQDRSKTKQRRDLTFKLGYHLGCALFKQAEAAQNPSTTQKGPAPKNPAEVYRKALEQFRQAIKTNPSDLEAKYNYELTLLRVKDAENRQQSDNQDQKNQQQDQKNQKDQKGQKDQKSQDQKQQDGQNQNSSQDQKQNQDSNKPNQKDQNAANQKQQSSKAEQGKQPANPKGMTREEAQRMLNMAENGDQYMAPIITDDSPVQKDW